MIVRGLQTDIANVSTAGAACFTFAATYGEKSEGLIGDRNVHGYYCRRGQEPIDDVETMEVLSPISTPGWG